jgi:hypothetical protein
MASKVALHKRLIQLTLSKTQSPIEFVEKWKGFLNETIVTNLVIVEEQQIMLLLVTLPPLWRSFITTQHCNKSNIRWLN